MRHVYQYILYKDECELTWRHRVLSNIVWKCVFQVFGRCLENVREIQNWHTENTEREQKNGKLTDTWNDPKEESREASVVGFFLAIANAF